MTSPILTAVISLTGLDSVTFAAREALVEFQTRHFNDDALDLIGPYAGVWFHGDSMADAQACELVEAGLAERSEQHEMWTLTPTALGSIALGLWRQAFWGLVAVERASETAVEPDQTPAGKRAAIIADVNRQRAYLAYRHSRGSIDETTLSRELLKLANHESSRLDEMEG